MSGNVHPDGRIHRRQLTRQAIIDAHAQLVIDGVLRPTAKEIATRSGISLRTFWLHFPEMEALFALAGQYWLDRDAGNWDPVPADLPLETRIYLFCDRRGARLEDIAPAAASALLAEPFSPALTDARRQHYGRLHDDLVETFGNEIGADKTDPRHQALFAAANAMTWLLLTQDEGLDTKQAIAVMRTTFLSVLLGAQRRATQDS